MQLITDHDNAVSAQVLPSGPTGIVEPEVGDPEDLLLDFIDSDETIAGGPDPGHRGLVERRRSPPPIRPGSRSAASAEAEAGEQEQFQRIHVEPFADLRELEYRPGADRRPGASRGARMIVTAAIAVRIAADR